MTVVVLARGGCATRKIRAFLSNSAIAAKVPLQKAHWVMAMLYNSLELWP
jgi:hypothetical protein